MKYFVTLFEIVT